MRDLCHLHLLSRVLLKSFSNNELVVGNAPQHLTDDRRYFSGLWRYREFRSCTTITVRRLWVSIQNRGWGRVWVVLRETKGLPWKYSCVVWIDLGTGLSGYHFYFGVSIGSLNHKISTRKYGIMEIPFECVSTGTLPIIVLGTEDISHSL